MSLFQKSGNKKQNLYSLLGVSKDSNEKEIKSAYRKLALKWHPDKNGGSEESTEMFKNISEAYAVLSNPQRRKKYDMYGETGQDDGLDDMFGNMDDMFASGMFGGMGTMDDDFDDFINILAQDDYTSFSSMFGGLGKNYRMGGRPGRKQTRAQAAKSKKGRQGGGAEDMMDEMMMAMMMGGMMADDGFGDMDAGFGFSMPGFSQPKKGKKNKPKKSEDDGWETDSGDEEYIPPKPKKTDAKSMLQLRSKEAYDKVISEAGLVVVYFMSYDCTKSKEISPQYKQYVKTQNQKEDSITTYCIVDTEENEEIVSELKIDQTPWFTIYQNGKIVEQIKNKDMDFQKVSITIEELQKQVPVQEDNEDDQGWEDCSD